MITIKSEEEMKTMVDAGRRLAGVIEELRGHVRAGIETRALDDRARDLIKKAGAKPAFLGYRPTGATKPYPATICVSINEVVVHGTPSVRVIKEGDVVKLDLGLILDGLYVDSAVTVIVGNASLEAKKLARVTEEALSFAIGEARPGNTLGDIGAAIQGVIEKTPFSIIKSLTGHGIGRALHEDPYVFNTGKRGEGEELKEGMVLALEPMVAVGSGKVRQLPDESYATVDGSLSAHFEHTVAITKDGPRVLTKI